MMPQKLTTLIVKEKMTDSEGTPVFFKIKNDISDFKLKDRIELRLWKQICNTKEITRRVFAKARGKEYSRNPPNFNVYIWGKESLLVEKATETGDEAALVRMAKFSKLSANHLMSLHNEIKKDDNAVEVSCHIPLIALNMYIARMRKIPLTGEMMAQAAKIAAELAQTYDKYGDNARAQTQDIFEALDKFIGLTNGVKEIEAERAAARGTLDKINAADAYNALLKTGGDEGVKRCRRHILEIRDLEIKQTAIKNCQAYWEMYWWSDTPPIELFPKEFMAALDRMEIMKN